MTYTTVSQMFGHVTNENLNKKLYFYKKDNDWIGLSGSDIRSTVKDLAFALQSLGVSKGSNVALLSNNSPRWAMSDYGIICSGAATVSVYPTLISSQVEYILNDSQSKVVFAENQEQMQKVMESWGNCPELQYAVVMDDSNTDSDDRIFNFMDFLDKGTKHEQDTEGVFDDLILKPEPNDLLTLIYTSGTTGNPKGVKLTHGNMMSNVEGTKQDISFDETEVFLSFLPLSHSFERMGGHFTAFSVGAQVYYAESIETVPDNLREVKPTVVLSVPRLYEKMYAKVRAGLKSAPEARQKIFWWAIGIGKEVTQYRLKNQALPFVLGIKHKIADKLVYSKVKDRVGGRLRFFVSGGAPLSQEIGEFFAAADIMILEGYGLSETSPVLTCNYPGSVRYGSVGKPLFNVDIEIAEDGEILAKGPNIMTGYYNNEEATREAVDTGGWFRSGDIGHIDDEGFLFITDRKKNILVTSAGKNVAPAPMENALTNSPFIEQVVIIGDKRNFISALIVPAQEAVENELSSQGKSVSGSDVMSDHPDVKALIKKEVDDVMKGFSNYERVKEFAILPRLFTIEDGELTPTLKVVRKVVLDHFSDAVEKNYSGSPKKVEEPEPALA
ncbi:MAG: long-chain fatty acid--CoA ligase [Candidatus Marinimicrobia bacterium]|nr:long-chain fatty acid--CoA ligase [Candidatus Neomarinimicrobiota bacterium]